MLRRLAMGRIAPFEWSAPAVPNHEQLEVRPGARECADQNSQEVCPRCPHIMERTAQREHKQVIHVKLRASQQQLRPQPVSTEFSERTSSGTATGELSAEGALLVDARERHIPVDRLRHPARGARRGTTPHYPADKRVAPPSPATALPCAGPTRLPSVLSEPPPPVLARPARLRRRRDLSGAAHQATPQPPPALRCSRRPARVAAATRATSNHDQ